MRVREPLEIRQSWRTLLGCTLGAAFGVVSLFIHSLGAFAPAFAAEQGYSAAELGVATLAMTLVIATAVPFAGHLADRYGALRIVALSIAGEGVGLMALAAASPEFPSFLLLTSLLAALGAATTPVGFARLIAGRFRLQRGLALGIMTSGTGVVAISAPPLCTMLIDMLAWRAAYLVMGAVVLCVGMISILLIRMDRHPPQDHAVGETAGGMAPPHLVIGQHALIILIFLLPTLACGGYLLHLIGFLRERGFSPLDSAFAQSLTGCAILIGRIATGALVDRIAPRIIVVFVFSGAALGCLLLREAGPGPIGLGAFLIGLAIGSEVDLLAYVMAGKVGLARFGRYYGFGYSALVVAGGASPLLLATLIGHYGYDVTLSLSAAIASLAVLLALVAPGMARHPAIR